MGESLRDYEVIDLVKAGSYGPCYKVRRKADLKEFVWKAISYKAMNASLKQKVLSNVAILREIDSEHLVRILSTIVHQESSTIYVIMESYQKGHLRGVIHEAKQTGRIFKEAFLWRVVYQVFTALSVIYTKYTMLEVLPSIKSDTIFLSENFDVKVSCLGFEKMIKAASEPPDARLDVLAAGAVLYELSTLKSSQLTKTKSPEEALRSILKQYSAELHSMARLLLYPGKNTVTLDSVLQHPALVSNTTPNQTLTDILITPPTLKAHQQVIDLKCYSEKLDNVRNREAAVRAKELKLSEMELRLKRREKKVALAERAAREKLARAELYLKRAKQRPQSASSNGSSKTKQMPEDALDSSLSADPGDTSLLPTSSKLNVDLIPKPNFNPTDKKRVHFKPKFCDDSRRALQTLDSDKKETTVKLSLWNRENRQQAFELFKMMDNKENDVRLTVLQTDL